MENNYTNTYSLNKDLQTPSYRGKDKKMQSSASLKKEKILSSRTGE